MRDQQRKQIYDELSVEETEDLLHIWQYGDIDEWDETDFEMIKEILLERLGDLPPQSIELQIDEIMYQLEDHLDNSEWEKALADCERALQLKPDLEMVYNARGEIYEEMEQLEQAMLNYQRAIELSPSFGEAWENMRRIEAILEEAFEDSPAKKPLDQAREHANRQEMEKALETCKSAEANLPPIALAYHELGMVYESLGQFDPAISAYRKAIHLNAEYKDAWKDMERLEATLEKGYFASPARQQLDQALEYLLAGEREKAMETCALLPNLPDLALAYYDLGVIRHALDQFDPAIEAYLKAIQLNPRFYPARENLAEARLAWEIAQYRLFTHRSPEEGEDIEYDESQMLVTTEPIPQWFYMDENAYLLPGWPGYRTRQGRSGYDPLTYEFELAHMQGTIIRALWVGKFRTRNPFYLVLMIYVGSQYFLAGILPFLFGNFGSILFGLTLSPYLVVGILLLVNVYRSFSGKASEEGHGRTFF